MIQDFKQVWVSQHGVEFFGPGFRSLWNLDHYHNTSAPAVFFGMYHEDDMTKLINHTGPKIVIWGGNDMQPNQLAFISNLQKVQKDLYSWAYPGEFSDILSSYGIRHKQLYVPLKDYSQFQPFELGENIYVYKGLHGNRPEHYQWNEIVQPLIQVFGSDRIIFSNHLSINDLIENVYKKCFVYVKPNPKGGCTTMFELAHMGIRTIGKKHKDLEFFTEYNDIHHLINLIVEESKHIGQLRENISQAANNVFTGPEWLTMEFWNE